MNDERSDIVDDAYVVVVIEFILLLPLAHSARILWPRLMRVCQE